MDSSNFLAPNSIVLRAAKVATITSTAYLAGKTCAQSFSAPALLLAPTPLLAEQWTTYLSKDRATAPLSALFSSGLFAYLAKKTFNASNRHETRQSLLYALASACLISWVPFSIFVLEPLNRKLGGKAAALRRQRRGAGQRPRSAAGSSASTATSPVAVNVSDFADEAARRRRGEDRSTIGLLLTLWTLDLWADKDEDHNVPAVSSAQKDGEPVSAASEVAVQDFESVHLLIDQWATLNLGRTLMAGLAAGMAAWATLGV